MHNGIIGGKTLLELQHHGWTEPLRNYETLAKSWAGLLLTGGGGFAVGGRGHMGAVTP